MTKKLMTLAVAGGLFVLSGHGHATIDEKTAASLMRKGQCVACHSKDKKLVGPSFREIALKRKHEKDGTSMLLKKVREGGVGAYGQIPMPPAPKEKISDDELKKLIEWALSI
jgi:cytochrome c